MRFRLPTSPHDWREFLYDVCIVVIGVLIALGAQQVVQDIHDRQVAQSTRAAVKKELQANLATLEVRKIAEPCIQRRLSELRGILRQWAETGSFETPSWVAQAPRFGPDFPQYEAAVAAGQMTLLPSDQQSSVGALVSNLRVFDTFQKQEMEPWSKLRLLQEGPKVLTSTDRTMLWEALQAAATLDYQERLRISQTLRLAAEHGYRPDMREFRQVASSIWKGGRVTPSICVDIHTPPDEANAKSGQLVPLPQ